MRALKATPTTIHQAVSSQASRPTRCRVATLTASRPIAKVTINPRCGRARATRAHTSARSRQCRPRPQPRRSRATRRERRGALDRRGCGRGRHCRLRADVCARVARARPHRGLIVTFAIGLLAVNVATRHRVGRDAWLLTAWWIVVGVAFSALMLEVVGLRSPLWRYPLTALVMYAIGVVVGMRVWLALFGRAARAAPDRYRGARADDPEAPSRLSVR